MTTIAYDAGHATPHGGLQVIEILAVDDCAQAVHQRRNNAVRGSDDLYPREVQSLPNGRGVLLVAGDTTEGLRNDKIKLSCPCGLQHVLDATPQ